MLKIGLTGGIGSGKSTVAKVFELLKVPVYYADEASKRLYHTDPLLRQSLEKHFGEEIYKADKLDREALAAIVFNDPQKLQLLNSLVHPPTIRDAANWMLQQTTAYAIKEAALLFESESEVGLDFVIGVWAPEELRITRVRDRENTTVDAVRARLNRQMNEEEKMKRCNVVISNDEKHAIIPQVLNLHQFFNAGKFPPRSS